MTKQEIKDLIAAKIAGQGSQVDSGGALDKVLNGIIDNIPEVASGYGLGGVWPDAEGSYELPDKTFAILGGNVSYTINGETIAVSENNIGILIYDSDNDDAYSLTEIPVGAGGGGGASVLDLGLTITCTVEDHDVTIAGANFTSAPNLEAIMAATAVKYVVDFGNNEQSEMQAAVTVVENYGDGVAITTGIYNEDMLYQNLYFAFADGAFNELRYYSGFGTLLIPHTIGENGGGDSGDIS